MEGATKTRGKMEGAYYSNLEVVGSSHVSNQKEKMLALH